MAYSDRVLLEGESIIHRAKVHRVFLLVPGFVLLIGLLSMQQDVSGPGPGLIFVLVGAFFFLRALLVYISTELTVTDRRVISKVGFISRDTTELSHGKVEPR